MSWYYKKSSFLHRKHLVSHEKQQDSVFQDTFHNKSLVCLRKYYEKETSWKQIKKFLINGHELLCKPNKNLLLSFLIAQTVRFYIYLFSVNDYLIFIIYLYLFAYHE